MSFVGLLGALVFLAIGIAELAFVAPSPALDAPGGGERTGVVEAPGDLGDV